MMDDDLDGRTGLKRGKSFYVTETALARVDHRIRAAFFRHERDKLVVVGHRAVGAEQTLRLPPSPAAPTAKIAAGLDAAHFGEGRQGPAHRNESFRPTFGTRW